MKNKSLLLKLGLLILGISGFGISFTSAVTLFHLNLEWNEFATAATRLITDRMMYVHFADNGNDFGWILYFSNSGSWDNILDPVESSTLYEVAPQWQKAYECRTQVKWFYYNAERGERLWPLDSWTFSGLNGMVWLNTTWWIYTSCTPQGYNEALLRCQSETDDDFQWCLNEVYKTYKSDGYGYYWYVEHTYSWQNMNLTVWVDYTGSNRFITIKSGSELSSTFVRMNNKYPLWFVYDYNGWLWLAWCRFVSATWWSMKNLLSQFTSRWWRATLFHYNNSEMEYIGPGGTGVINCSGVSFADTLTRILVEWVIWLTDTTADKGTIYWIKGNQSDSKTQWFDTQSVNTNTLMNYTRRKAEILCRWTWTGNTHVFGSNKVDVICWNGEDVDAAHAKTAKDKDQTLIVKQGNVTIEPMLTYNEGGNYDIYILDGDLLIDETGVTDDNKFLIDESGYVTGGSLEKFRVFTLAELYGIDNISTLTSLILCKLDGVGCAPWHDADGDEEVTDNDANLWLQYLKNRDGFWTAVASTIKWNFVVNWGVKSAEDDSTLNNKYFIYGKFTSNDSISDLEKVFTWKCSDVTWEWSDGNLCPKNAYQNYALVVIDQNYKSPILNS